MKLRKKISLNYYSYNPTELGNLIEEYFDFIAENKRSDSIIVGKNNDLVDLPKNRAPTIEGFCNFLGIPVTKFREYMKNPDYEYCCTMIEQFIYAEAFEGAATGEFVPSVIIRKLGLTEKKEVNSTSNVSVQLFIPKAIDIASSAIEIEEGEDFDFIDRP